jgi:3-hydroxymyristoyl/3-hydroxydecanoyl-(acyl carrier protein) dehydratase
VLFLRDLPDRDRKLFYFGGVDKARFRKPVLPGDQLVMELEVLQKRGTSVRLRGTAKVEGAVVAEAEFLSVMVDRPQ